MLRNKPKVEESTDLSGRLRAKLRLEREDNGTSGTVWLDITFDDLPKSVCIEHSNLEHAEAVFYGMLDEDEDEDEDE